MRVSILFLGVALAGLAFGGGAAGGDKVEKLDVGAKGLEVKAELKTDDPKIKFEFMGKIFLMPSKQFELKMAPGARYRFVLDTDSPKLDPFLIIKNQKGD